MARSVDERSQIYLFEKLISSENKENESWSHLGYCEVCRSAQKFWMDWRYSDGISLNFRERLVCDSCGLNNRQRFMAQYIKSIVNQSQEKQIIYCYEQVTTFYRTISNQLADHVVIGSEYLGYDVPPGEKRANIRHEDALQLSFSDESLHLIVSNDVYEHVPDISQTLKEAYRVLKKNGKLIVSTPFFSNAYDSVKRAELVNGKVKYRLPAQYHGNPLSSKGSLVFYDFGWDFLDQCKKVGFEAAYVIGYHSVLHGYLGGLQPIFHIEK